MAINPLRDIASLFFTPVCPVCGDIMGDGMRTVCNKCRWEAPATGFWQHLDNPVARKFWGLVPIHTASSFIYFIHGNGYRQLIHDFKYRGQWRLARQMGEWFGGELTHSELYKTIDVLIPVPLHGRKRIRRGYNQSEYIARGMAYVMNTELSIENLIKSRYNLSQTGKNHRERWDNVKDIFSVRHPEKLQGKHILLVDDVLTTGATIASCAEVLLKEVEGCTISIATLAVSKKHIDVA